MAINREFSQFSNFVEVDDVNQNITIATGSDSQFVGIGTLSPQVKVQVKGSAIISGITTIGNVRIGINSISAASGIITYYGSGAGLTGVIPELKLSKWESVASGIVTTRNIGIGTVVANQALWVSGNSYVSGFSTVGGNATIGGNVSIGGTVSITGNLSANNFTTNSISFGNTSLVSAGRTISDVTIRNYTETLNSLGRVSGITTIRLSEGNVVNATLIGNTTFNIQTGVSTGSASFTLILTNDSVGGYSVTWPASIKWPDSVPPSRSTGANLSDVWIFLTPNNGATWYGNIAMFNFS
jgi:hypothetical protein